ncbi:MAG: hypothetical protein JOS17DRAFT_743070 [Linnemannia elongata]|nr:MAG: hypothetical protein JOS17DRAFT_743070 [Linnemannia elongata]
MDQSNAMLNHQFCSQFPNCRFFYVCVKYNALSFIQLFFVLYCSVQIIPTKFREERPLTIAPKSELRSKKKKKAVVFSFLCFIAWCDFLVFG